MIRNLLPQARQVQLAGLVQLSEMLWEVHLVRCIGMLVHILYIFIRLNSSNSIYLSALAQSLQKTSTGSASEPTRAEYASAAEFALDRLYNYTRARPPSRTLVDPLEAFVKSLKDPHVALPQAFDTAQQAAENTKTLPARAGRAAYVDADTVKGICDPGAWGVRCLLRGLLKMGD